MTEKLLFLPTSVVNHSTASSHITIAMNNAANYTFVYLCPGYVLCLSIFRARIISWRFCVNIFWNAMYLAQKLDH